MLRVLGICLGIVVLAIVAYPFVQDAYFRYQVGRRLDTVMDSRERAEFRQWPGDAMSFARTLYERCERSQGDKAVQCERYRYAFE
ncbi:MAG: hypothetical protein JO001_08355 [Alphaproteobacteria bacterium]|nr:hypothetical protein [Alphaproteobacteria bacterium]